MGLSTFAGCNYRMSRVNATTRAKAQQIDAMLTVKTSS
jgi:hypothetical protein